MPLSPFHALYTARELSCFAQNADKLTAAYASSDIAVFPYQVAAAMFALRSPYLKGAILADEGSLGKTYEALLVITQMWFEGRERILLVVPTPLLGQWVEIIENCFSVPCQVDGDFDFQGITLTTYENAVQKADEISRVAWNVAVFEEAHRLSNHESKTAATLKNAVGNAYKLLLTATPMQNSIMDLYGLIHFIDDELLGDSDEFYKQYFRKPQNYHELSSRVSRYVFRTLRSQVESYVKIPHRVPVTVDCKPNSDELYLAEKLAEYLEKPVKSAFPKMDKWELSLMLWRSLSSSTFAFDKLLQGAIEREAEPELVELQELSSKITVISKGQELLKILKKAFTELKKRGANKKALIFTESRATQKYLKNLLTANGYNTLTYNGDKSRDYGVMKRFEGDVDILISTDIAAEGFNLAFCSFVVNFDLPYNVLTLEQRIMRCHRQGQQNDVLVLNFLSKNNLADTRMLELINKRVSQFDGIIGMSDDVVGEFVDSVESGVWSEEFWAKFRHKRDIEAEFQAALMLHEEENISKVNAAENALFTTFTPEIAKKVTITPQYIKDRTDEINAKLWALTKWFFAGKQGYDCVDETRTLRIGIQSQKVFTGGHLGRREYSIDDKTLPKSGRHTLCGSLAKNIIKEVFWRGVPDCGEIVVKKLDKSCKIGYYEIVVKTAGCFWGGYKYYVFAGMAADGGAISDEKCREIMALPVVNYTAERETYGVRDGLAKPKLPHEIDKLINADEFAKRAVVDTDEARREQVAHIQDRAYYQKQELNRNIAVLKNQLAQIENALSRAGNVAEKIAAEKKRATSCLELKQREQSLFMDGIRLDVEAENAVIEITEQANLVVEIKREFVIQVLGENRNGTH